MAVYKKRPKQFPFYAVLGVQAMFITIPSYLMLAFISTELNPLLWGLVSRLIFLLVNLFCLISLIRFWVKREIEVDQWEEDNKPQKTFQEKVAELRNSKK